MIVNKYKIIEICQLNKNSYSKKDKWRFFNYLDTKNIVQNEIDNIEFLDPSIDKIPSRAKRKVDNEDIIISTVRPNQKHYGIIRNQLLNFLVSTAFTTLSVNKNIAMPLYVYYYITQNYIIEFLQTIAEQATTSYPSIKASDIGNLDISLPDLEYQNKVISILNNLDSKINFNKKLNHNLPIKCLIYTLLKSFDFLVNTINKFKIKVKRLSYPLINFKNHIMLKFNIRNINLSRHKFWKQCIPNSC